MKNEKEPDLLNINIKIFEHPEAISISIPREEEEMYRKAGLTINTLIKKYREKHQESSYERVLVFALLHIVVKGLKNL